MGDRFETEYHTVRRSNRYSMSMQYQKWRQRLERSEKSGGQYLESWLHYGFPFFGTIGAVTILGLIVLASGPVGGASALAAIGAVLHTTGALTWFSYAALFSTGLTLLAAAIDFNNTSAWCKRHPSMAALRFLVAPLLVALAPLFSVPSYFAAWSEKFITVANVFTSQAYLIIQTTVANLSLLPPVAYFVGKSALDQWQNRKASPSDKAAKAEMRRSLLVAADDDSEFQAEAQRNPFNDSYGIPGDALPPFGGSIPPPPPQLSQPPPIAPPTFPTTNATIPAPIGEEGYEALMHQYHEAPPGGKLGGDGHYQCYQPAIYPVPTGDDDGIVDGQYQRIPEGTQLRNDDGEPQSKYDRVTILPVIEAPTRLEKPTPMGAPRPLSGPAFHKPKPAVAQTNAPALTPTLSGHLASDASPSEPQKKAIRYSKLPIGGIPTVANGVAMCSTMSEKQLVEQAAAAIMINLSPPPSGVGELSAAEQKAKKVFVAEITDADVALITAKIAAKKAALVPVIPVDQAPKPAPTPGATEPPKSREHPEPEPTFQFRTEVITATRADASVHQRKNAANKIIGQGKIAALKQQFEAKSDAPETPSSPAATAGRGAESPTPGRGRGMRGRGRGRGMRARGRGRGVAPQHQASVAPTVPADNNVPPALPSSTATVELALRSASSGNLQMAPPLPPATNTVVDVNAAPSLPPVADAIDDASVAPPLPPATDVVADDSVALPFPPAADAHQGSRSEVYGTISIDPGLLSRAREMQPELQREASSDSWRDSKEGLLPVSVARSNAIDARHGDNSDSSKRKTRADAAALAQAALREVAPDSELDSRSIDPSAAATALLGALFSPRGKARAAGGTPASPEARVSKLDATGASEVASSESAYFSADEEEFARPQH